MTPRRHLRRPVTVSALSAAAIAAGLLIAPAQASADQVRIHDIQGSTRLSPLAGQTVSDVPGVVTGVRTYGSNKGFWLQDPQPDDNPATSEGIFVYTSATPTVKVGDSVTVTGTVDEYYPGGASTGVQSITELGGKPVVTVVSSGNPVPAPVVLDAKDIPDAYAPDAAGANIEPLTLQPKKYALDLFESLEDMNVEVDNARVVGPTDAYSELWVTAKPGQEPTRRGGTVYEGYDNPNSGRIQVQSLIPTAQAAFPQADTGDELTGATTGPLDYNQYGGYTIAANAIGTLKSGGLKPEVTAKQKKDQLALATYNVENLAPGDPDSKYTALAAGVVDNLQSPDIVALEEIQDNDGATDDGVVACDQTVQKFVDAIKAAGGPAYDWRSINPVNDQDGGEPGGNIRQVFLFNPARVSFDDIPGGDSTTAVGVAKDHGQARLTASPGRIDPADSAWTASRKPLVGQFEFQGKRVFVIANHLVAKLGDQGLDSRFQPATQSSMAQRLQQAQVENGFVKQLLAVDKHADVVALGDLNDFQFSPALAQLTDGGVLKDLITTLPVKERYSYDYEGNSEVLDHILTSPALTNAQYDVVHINAEFAHQTSDHDPQVVRVRP
ncbi:endonuclease/exonuclease/phosphatase [Streptomyces sp. SL13]|uniref:Endonuclease/exonuclease/phosphatase n=1 Tax=Streptantibioticus silvisoli TaxID=2705255 RepID=A0AA90HE28_9ACTN|nr:endonuclease/exonuclease/phosphatase family protein [Streptantibioticus silvisoli]MDI5973192.1 endonuclease/exonuclease/phosphatase [Streptantibioticus silvisoli]